MFSRREIPQIAGSSTGFIALIVVLVLIITTSFIAVCVILYRSTSPDNTRTRSDLYHPPADTSLSSTSEYPYEATAKPPVTWRQKLDRMFGLGKGGEKTRGGVVGRRGQWTQAGSGDDWDLNADVESARPDARPRARGAPAVREREGPSSSKRVSGVTFEPPSRSRTTSPNEEPGRRMPTPSSLSLQPSMSSLSYDLAMSGSTYFTDPSLYGPINSAVPEGVSPTSSKYHVLARSETPDTISRSPPVPSPLAEAARSQLTSQSVASVRTFQGGTKFIEDL